MYGRAWERLLLNTAHSSEHFPLDVCGEFLSGFCDSNCICLKACYFVFSIKVKVSVIIITRVICYFYYDIIITILNSFLLFLMF